MLARFTLIDYDREMALVAVRREQHRASDGSLSEAERIIGVAGIVTLSPIPTARVASSRSSSPTITLGRA